MRVPERPLELVAPYPRKEQVPMLALVQA
jgi:hypothetical protein